MSIHSTAIIEEGASLGNNVSVGPYAFIGKDVQLGDDCIIHHHATVEGTTTLGQNNEVFPYALIGGKTHDLKFQGGTPRLEIGSNNIFREYCNIHTATNDGDTTQIGDHNFFLSHCHVGHDCMIGNHVILSQATGLSGHVILEDYVITGGKTGIHQHCRIGQHAFIGGMARITQSILPFMLVEGEPAKVRTINQIGLQRRGFSEEDRSLIRTIFKLFYKKGLNRSQALEKVAQLKDQNPSIVDTILTFVKDCQRSLL